MRKHDLPDALLTVQAGRSDVDASGTKPQILNISEDAATRQHMAALLERAGYTPSVASDAAMGLALARKSPDLIILDGRVSELDGSEVCRQLKADPATSTIPLLQISAASMSTESKAQGLDNGADAYLVQPIDDLELIAMVRAMLRTHRAEEAERLACWKWQRTFDAMSDGVLVLDAERMIIESNRAMCKVLGPAVEHAPRQSLASLLRQHTGYDFPDIPPPTPQNKRWELELPLRGRWYRLVADAAPAPRDQGLTVVVFSDVTDRKRLEESYRDKAVELASNARRKDEFLAMLAHELRNPLNAIVASNELQETFGPRDEESLRLRSVVARQSRHLSRLIDDLLDVSRITRGEIDMQVAVLDLPSILLRAYDSQRALLDRRGQRFTLELPEGTLPVEGDDQRLEQIIANLLANASKYSPPGSTIALSLREEQRAGRGWAVITVRDEGIGIAGDMLEAVFEMFVQVDRSLARTQGGLGLGLTVVRHVVERHGGQVTAHSDGLGRGSSFVVRLPRSESAQVPQSPERPALSNTPAKLEVLLVEDNDDTRELVSALLETRGHNVHAAADGGEGVQLAQQNSIDVALIDIGLPGMNGYEVAEQLRAQPASSKAYLIAVTGYGSPEDKARSRRAGFDAHIVKPLDSAKLFSLLQQRSGRAQATVAGTT